MLDKDGRIATVRKLFADVLIHGKIGEGCYGQTIIRGDEDFLAIGYHAFTRSEVKYISTINVAEIQKRADELAKNYRDLDARVQELNWQTELVE
jgi:hypothetical protein